MKPASIYFTLHVTQREPMVKRLISVQIVTEPRDPVVRLIRAAVPRWRVRARLRRQVPEAIKRILPLVLHSIAASSLQPDDLAFLSGKVDGYRMEQSIPSH